MSHDVQAATMSAIAADVLTDELSGRSSPYCDVSTSFTFLLLDVALYRLSGCHTPPVADRISRHNAHVLGATRCSGAGHAYAELRRSPYCAGSPPGKCRLRHRTALAPLQLLSTPAPTSTRRS